MNTPDFCESEAHLSDEEQSDVPITTADKSASREMKWDSLLNFTPETDTGCLMGNRYLGRSGGMVIVAPSGVGKSVLSMHLGACAALGMPFFGVRMSSPMRVLYVQAEDDLGDVAEAAQGFVKESALSDRDIAALKARMRIVRWNDASGGVFLLRLKAELRAQSYDLVIINPLFSFAGCNVSDQEAMSGFLRNGLNPILNDTQAACVIVHHTNKPKEDDKARTDSDSSYLGSGSAELTNWARAYVTLQQAKSAGTYAYKLLFAKRGRRAGLVDDDGRPTTSVLIEHSPSALYWKKSDASATAADGKFKAKFDLPRARQYYDPELPWSQNEKVIAADQGVSTRTVRNHQRTLEREN